MLGAFKEERLRRHNEHYSSGRVFGSNMKFCFFIN